MTIDADFAKYDSFEQSITAHAGFFIRNKRYAKALQCTGKPDEFCREIRKAGYGGYAQSRFSNMDTYGSSYATPGWQRAKQRGGEPTRAVPGVLKRARRAAVRCRSKEN